MAAQTQRRQSAPLNPSTFPPGPSSNRCSQCSTWCFDAITDVGHTVFEDVEELRASATREDHESCDVCSMLWWSLRWDHGKILGTEASQTPWNVRLYRHPLLAGGASPPILRIDVMVMPPDKGHDFLWVQERPWEWHYGPPDAKPDIARGHVTVYAGHGTYKGSSQASCFRTL